MDGATLSAFAVYKAHPELTTEPVRPECDGLDPFAQNEEENPLSTPNEISLNEGAAEEEGEVKSCKLGKEENEVDAAETREGGNGDISKVTTSEEEVGGAALSSASGMFVSTKRKKKMALLLREVMKKKKKSRKLVRSSVKKYKVKSVRKESEGSQTSSEDMVEDIPFRILFDKDSYSDSRMAAKNLFALMIKPLDPESFFRDSWEKRPVLLRRRKHHYNEGWFSTQELDFIFRNNHLEFTRNVDVTTYEDGVRKTHNLDGRATAPAVWDFYKNGCSVRLLNPQSYSKGIWLLNSTMQELFSSCMGANVYLTPPGSQGFAPHYDDIEAFVLQLEGRKRWKLYGEKSQMDRLPRSSSCNLTESDLGEPVLEAVLEPGDLLYFPRGTIHQATTLSKEHSLHVTLSTFQRNSWADLLEKLVPAALEVAINEDPEFRSGLPLDYLQYMGVVFSDSNDPRRAGFIQKISSLFAKLNKFVPIDAAVDQLGSDFIHGSLPPYETSAESSHMAVARGDRWEGDRVVDGEKLTESTRVKLIRYGVIRLVMEKDGVALFNTATNSRLNSAESKCGVYIDGNEASGIDYLIHSYPKYVTIRSIPLQGNSATDKIDFCYTLFLQGILIIENRE